jgi:methyl-accepting chemotaxis protein
MLQTYSNLGIGARLYVGFGLILLLAAFQALMSGIETSYLGRNFTAYSNMASDALLVSEIGGDMGELRLATNRYMSTNADIDMENANKAYEEVRHGVEVAHEEIQNPSRLKLIIEIDALSIAYKKGFEQITDLIQKRNTVVDKQLDILGPDIREKLTGLNEKLTRQGDHQTANLAGIVQEDFLSARLYVTKFLDTNELSAIDRARTEFREVEVALEHLKSVIGQEHIQVISDVEKELPKYELAFEDLAKVIAERNKIRTQVLDVNGKAIGEKITAVIASAHEDENNLQSDTEKSASNSELQNIVMAAVMTIMGVVIAWFVGRGITGPVTALTLTMGRLADSDWKAEVVGADRKDELGQMARAVFIFKENGVAAERLQAEQRTEQEKKEARAKQIEFDIGMFEQTVASMLEMLASAATELQSTAQSMNSIADEGQRQSSTVAAASEEASVNVQTVAAAGEELSSSIVEISRQVSESARISSAASEHAQKTNDQIKGLAEAANRIGEV